MIACANPPIVSRPINRRARSPLRSRILTGRRRAFRVRHHHPAGIARHRAGADVLYAPGVRDIGTIRTVVSALGKPFNLVMGFADPTLTVDQLSAAGVKRISVGGAMSRFALAAFLKCAREMKDKRSFTYVREMAPIKDLREAFAAVEG